jgi:hypothetical protein
MERCAIESAERTSQQVCKRLVSMCEAKLSEVNRESVELRAELKTANRQLEIMKYNCHQLAQQLNDALRELAIFDRASGTYEGDEDHKDYDEYLSLQSQVAEYDVGRDVFFG